MFMPSHSLKVQNAHLSYQDVSCDPAVGVMRLEAWCFSGRFRSNPKTSSVEVKLALSWDHKMPYLGNPVRDPMNIIMGNTNL